jgi:Helix-turn-helix domain
MSLRDFRPDETTLFFMLSRHATAQKTALNLGYKRNARLIRREARQLLQLQPGEVFDPARLFSQKQLTGGLLPSEIRECRELSMGAKVLYSALMEWKATLPQVCPSLDRLARDMGVSPKQARRYLQELERHKLIRVSHREDGSPPDRNDTTEYHFLYHELFNRLPAPEEGAEDPAPKLSQP